MFDIYQRIEGEGGEHDEKKVQDYIHGLMTEFGASPEGKALLESGHELSWPAMMMEYGLGHLGLTPPEMSLPDFDEVVFELFPRKVSTKPESAAEIIEELRAFWQFLQRQYSPPNAAKILEALDDSARNRLSKLLADPSNFGMAKSFIMMGQEAGFDMTTQEGLDRFLIAYNSKLLAGRSPAAFRPNVTPPAGPAFDTGGPPAGQLTPKQRAEKRKANKRHQRARKGHRK
jgi:hypothetical protein